MTTSYKAFSVSLLQATTQPCKLVSLDGAFAGTGTVYLQIHDSRSTPATGSVPIKSFVLLATGPLPSIFATLEGFQFSNGLFIGLSSTEGTYTASSELMSVFGEVTDIEPLPTLSTAGNLVTAVASLAVWTDANGPKKLYQVTATNATGGATQYLLLFAKDSPINGDVALSSWAFTDGQTRNISFGAIGFSPVLSGNDGCKLVASTTAGTLTNVAGTPWKIMAFYA